MLESRPPIGRSTALLLICVVLVGASGCLGLTGDGSTQSDPRAERVQQQALAAMANVSTYEATMSMTVESDGNSLHADVEGATNETSRRMSFDMTIDLPNGPAEEATAYVVEGQPDESAVKEAIRNAPSDATSLEDVSIEQFSITHYIGHDEYDLRKVRMDMTIEQEGETAEMTMTIAFSRHGEPIRIDLPPGVESS